MGHSASRSAAVALVCTSTLAFRVAVVEHRVILPCGSASCGAETKAANVVAFASYAANASQLGAQIVVFPEYGITGASSYPRSAWVSGGYTETFPEATDAKRVVPCDSSSTSGAFSAAPSVRALSCAARRESIAIVANLAEYDRASGLMYNTDVVFDTDGAFIVTYRKQNLYGEREMSTPLTPRCAEVTFNTTFGVRFGIFTCADLIYAQPAVRLLQMPPMGLGVRHFVMPTSWSNVDAQMQVGGYAQGWSLLAGPGTSLAMANGRQDRMESGSGIWSGGVPLAFAYDTSSSVAGQVLVAEVAESVAEPVAEVTAAAEASAVALPSRARMAVNSSRHLMGLGRVHGAVRNDWLFAPLSAGKLCSPNGLCCSVRTGSETEASHDSFVIAVVDGIDGSGGTSWSAHGCSILPCSTADESCLRYRAPPLSHSAGALASVTVSLCGLAAGDMTVPEVIASSGAHEQIMLHPNSTKHALAAAHANGNGFSAEGSFQFVREDTGDCATLAVETTASSGAVISSASIYGRRFADDVLPYSC